MLSLERNARPTPVQVLEVITSPEDDDTSSTADTFCGICCVPDFESDSMDSLADNFNIVTAVPRAGFDTQAYQSTHDQASDINEMTQKTVQTASEALPVSSLSLGTTMLASYMRLLTSFVTRLSMAPISTGASI
jgi:hypothetical protein